ncbi:MAG: dihydroneopterin aldolase [Halothiobacillaceae bacterium]|nr:MAG: dihydroneopterin aldolase [Halothiobacillaceae bacterium]
MDIVFIADLRIETIIGIYDWERVTPQTVRLDLEMGWDNRAPAAGDDIAKALDYKSVSHRIVDYIRESQFLLVETMAEKVAEIVMTEFGSPWVRVRVAKPGAVRGAAEVGVEIERGVR